MSATITMWLLRETEKARFYSQVRLDRRPDEGDGIWVPKSIIEHTSKRGIEHDVTLPDWFIEEKGL